MHEGYRIGQARAHLGWTTLVFKGVGVLAALCAITDVVRGAIAARPVFGYSWTLGVIAQKQAADNSTSKGCLSAMFVQIVMLQVTVPPSGVFGGKSEEWWKMYGDTSCCV